MAAQYNQTVDAMDVELNTHGMCSQFARNLTNEVASSKGIYGARGVAALTFESLVFFFFGRTGIEMNEPG